MRCLVCDQDSWKNVDEFRDLKKHEDSPINMSMCNNCGFVSYPSKYKTKEEIKEHYKKNYRGGPPGFNHFVTGERKLHYHRHFLREVFLKWKDNKTKPVIGEVGAAIGLPLNMYLQMLEGECEVHGTEWDVKSRMVAFHEFGIRLGEELPEIKYDLLQTFKVAEHQMDVDLELKNYHRMLKDDGYLYISVPTWFGSLGNFGVGGFNLEYYYHTDHINVWTKKLFESVLKKTGFSVIKYDNYMYGDTYLCKKTDPQPLSKDDFEDPREILKSLEKVRDAAAFFSHNKFKEAISLWPDFPVAWQGLYEYTRKDLHQKTGGDVEQIVNSFVCDARNALGDSEEADRIESDINMRYGNYGRAAEILDKMLSKKPNQAGTLMQLAHCFRQMSVEESNPDKKIEFRLTARDICRQVVQLDRSATGEAVNWAMVDNSSISIDDFIDYAKRKQKELKKQQGVENGKSLR